MSKQQGCGGMGSHKHGVSGVCGPSPKKKFAMMLLANQEIKEKEKTRKMRSGGQKFNSVSELMEAHRSKKN